MRPRLTEDSLVGVQKLQAHNSNVATNHITDASYSILRDLAEGISLRFKQVVEYSDTKDDYISAIGKNRANLIQDLSDIGTTEFGINLEIGPTEEDKHRLNEMLHVAVSRDLVAPEDVLAIQGETNVKVAERMLSLKRKEREAEKHQMAIENSQASANATAEAGERTEAAKAQTEAIKADLKAQQSKLELELEKARMNHERELEKELLYIKQGMQMEVIAAQTQAGLMQGAQKGESDLKKEEIKGKIKGVSSPNINNKSNTIDGELNSDTGLVGKK